MISYGWTAEVKNTTKKHKKSAARFTGGKTLCQLFFLFFADLFPTVMRTPVETEMNFLFQYLMLKIRITKNIREVVEKKLHECIALNEYYIVVKPKSTTISLKDTLRVWVQELSQRWMKVKVAKWCWKK